MAGKYSKVIDKLPRIFDVEPKYQEKVEVVKRTLLTEQGNGVFAPATTLASLYEEFRGTDESASLMTESETEEILLRFGKEGLEFLLSEINLRIEAVTQLMVAQFEVEGVSSIKMERHSVSVQYEPYPKIEDKAAFRKWCVENGLEDSLQLHPSSMASITKERLLEGLNEPDGVKAYQKPYLVRRKA